MYNEIPVTEPIEKIFDSFWNLHRTEGREIRDVKAEREQNRVSLILSYIWPSIIWPGGICFMLYQKLYRLGCYALWLIH